MPLPHGKVSVSSIGSQLGTAVYFQNGYLEEEKAGEQELQQMEMELGPIMNLLKIGTSMTRFLVKKRNATIEPKTFVLNTDEFKIFWYRGTSTREEGKGML